MSFDTAARNRLAKLVGDVRDLLTTEFIEQCQSLFGIEASGRITEVQQLGHLDEAQRATAILLRERLEYLARTHPEETDVARSAVAQLVREQAFTVLNRLAALRMAEKRDLVAECVGRGYQSRGFKVFEAVTRTGLGASFDRYRQYLFCLCDELALDLGALFDRRSPHGMLFPREPTLLRCLDLLNESDIDPLWTEDETIGWIYQYYNDPEERKKMREAAAPRDGRELAVRNQFFTPRFVVQFLTDNTLGRLWYDATQGSTALTELCSYLLDRPDETSFQDEDGAPTCRARRASVEKAFAEQTSIRSGLLKDPRVILMLDPACGSMHFGLYAFELFETIYDEAWRFEETQGPEVFVRKPGMKSLHETYVKKADFLKDIPRLIVENNIHGIDIDLRCTQIAALSLWLRAQKSWQRLGLKGAERPVIRKSNIVCAEPMPGDKDRLREFVADAFVGEEQTLFGQLLESVSDSMQSAGEAGSLLRIEEDIRNAVATAKQQWEQQSEVVQAKLFDHLKTFRQADVGGQITGVTTEQFWETAEARLYAALRDYAERTESGDGVQRRLFAEDAARGFAFIDACRKRYDVIVMNPPFGEATRTIYLRRVASETGSTREIASLFVTRAMSLSEGRIGVLATRMLLFLDQLADWRKHVLTSWHFSALADFGIGVLDAVIDTAAIVICPGSRGRGVFVRLLSCPDKESGLKAMLGSRDSHMHVFIAENRFDQIQGHRIAYWAPKAWLALFVSTPLRACALVSKGLETGNDERFLRLNIEVPVAEMGKRWRRYAKGGDYQPFAGNQDLVVDYKLLPVARRRTDSGCYGRPGITYTQRTTSFLSFRALSEGTVFSPGGPGIIPECASQLEVLISYLNSRPIGALVDLCVGSGDSAIRGGSARNYTTGIIRSLPDLTSRLSPSDQQQVVSAVRARFACVQQHQLSSSELSPTFVLAAGIGPANSLRKAWTESALSEIRDSVQVIEDDLAVDAIWQRVFGFSESDSATLDAEFARHPGGCSGGVVPDSFWTDAITVSQQESGEEDDANDAEPVLFPIGGNRQLVKRSHVVHRRLETLALRFNVSPRELARNTRFIDALADGLRGGCQSVVSYLLGVAFGRWDVRLATGERPVALEPEPFDRLPVCPPGMLQSGTGLPARQEDVPTVYPIRIPWDGILVDDPSHSLDIERRVRHTIEIIWKDSAEAIEREACEILGAKSLRDYFRRPAGFFGQHLGRYSKSRRQAPIYWPLSTASGGYTLWMYYHRLTDQTLHTALADFVDPKIRDIERQVNEARSADRANELGDWTDLLLELREFRAELERVSRIPWKPSLHDGVLITASPLWKLFRLPKWQRDLKLCWYELQAGHYDWADLALCIWPDRVKAACRKDRSIAIAHGLEDLFQEPAPMKKAASGRRAREADRSQ
jgi:hypothetical protein